MTPHPTKSSQARTPGDAEQRLLASAQAAFAAKGYSGTTTREIAAGAGMSAAAMYIHFSSKQEVLSRLSLLGHAQALAALRAGVEVAGSSPTRRLRSAVYAFAYWHAENHTVGRIVQYELEALDDSSRAGVFELRADIVEIVHEILADGARNGEFAVGDIAATTLSVLSLCIDVVRWYPARELQTPEAVASHLADIAGRIVRAAP